MQFFYKLWSSSDSWSFASTCICNTFHLILDFNFFNEFNWNAIWKGCCNTRNLSFITSSKETWQAEVHWWNLKTIGHWWIYAAIVRNFLFHWRNLTEKVKWRNLAIRLNWKKLATIVNCSSNYGLKNLAATVHWRKLTLQN